MVEALEAAAQGASDWGEIATALEARKLEKDDPLRKLAYAFHYVYVSESSHESRERYGPYGPHVEWTDGTVYPPPVSTLGDDTLVLYDAILRSVTHPLMCSRLADLLWVRKWSGRPDLYARQAIHAYMELAPAEKLEFKNVQALQRALALAREINEAATEEQIISATLVSISQELAQTDLRPGISLTLMEGLMRLPKARIPDEIDQLMELALRVYRDNPWIVETVYELKVQRLAPEQQKDLRRAQVNIWVENAENGTTKGIARLGDLQHALELARNYGLDELTEQIRHKIQSIPDEELDLQTISAKVAMPADEVERFLNTFVDEKGWRESLIRFGAYGPPSGQYAKNVEIVERLAQEHPLQFLVAGFVYQENNVLIRAGKDEDENKKIAVSQQESIGIGVFGRFAPEIVRRIVNRHGLPSVDQLTEFFTSALIPKDIAENVALAVDWYNKGEYDVSAHLLVPRLEAVFRRMARRIGIVIIREPIGVKLGGVVPLGSLLSQMTDRMDESWRRYFYNALADPIGMNLRNRISHGLLAEATREDACVLLHIACHLSLMEISQGQTAPLPKNE